MRSTSASAVCATTRPSRAQCRRAVDPRLPSRSRSRLGSDARSAGSPPQRSAASAEATPVKSSVLQRTATSPMRGTSGGTNLR